MASLLIEQKQTVAPPVILANTTAVSIQASVPSLRRGPQGERGFTGDQGEQGIQGIQGIQGDIGLTGDQGIQGERGIQGETGAQGIQGIQGIQGDIGLTGDQGIQGIQGIKGDTGLTGDTGSQGIQGEQGFKGEQGIQGIQGIQGLKGDLGLRGESFSIDETCDLTDDKFSLILSNGSVNDIWVAVIQSDLRTTKPHDYSGHILLSDGLKITDGGQFTGLKGDKGEQGEQGLKGDQGIQGLIGITGAQGIQGIQGLTGLTGVKGDTGSQGIQGIQGIKGDKGDKGDVGAMPAGLAINEWRGISSVTPYGYIQFGPANASTAHIYTDRLNFHFNKELLVNGNAVYHQGFKPSAADVGALAVSANAVTATRLSTDRTNYTGVTDSVVVGQLQWTNYGNGHTVFDASKSVSPNGVACNNRDATNPWASSYPTLMGWNGNASYGVRVDSSRVSDTTSSSPSSLPLIGGNMSGTIGRASHASGYLVGSYNSVGANESKSNPIYTIGSNYKPTDVALGNMYGIGYSSSSFWGADKSIGWGLYVSEAGGVVSTLSASGIWTIGQMAAASFIGNANVEGTGTAIHCPGGIYSKGTNWLYGQINTNNNSINAGTGTITSGIINASGLINANAGLSQDGHVIFNGSDTWMRTSGATGWYNTTYGGGISMEDATWVRIYGSKAFYVLSTANDSIRTSGGIYASGNITAYSDVRIKDNIEVIDSALDKVCQVRGVTYTRTDLDDKNKKYTGVIAQELQKVLPEAVYENTVDVDDDLETFKDGKRLSVAYGNVVGLLIEAIKEERLEREKLNNEVDSIKAMIVELQQVNAIRREL